MGQNPFGNVLAAVVLTSNLSAIVPAKAWERSTRAQGVLGDYVDSLKSERAPAVISACQLSERIKIALISQPGESPGRLFVITDKIETGNAFAAISGTVTVQGGKPTLSLETGRAFDALTQVIVNLLAAPHSTIPLGEMGTIFSAPATWQC
jgi:hypothetical protein